MSLPNMSDISYFIEVADTKNISRAAERIGISQPSLSQAMQRLETALDSNLIIRERIGIRLTQSGKEFLVQAKTLLQQWELTCQSVRRKEDEVTGSFKLGCHPSVALYSLSKFLPRLIKKYSGLKIDLVHDLSRNIAEKVVSCEVDYGIVVNPVSHPEFVINKLATDEITLWAHSNLAKVKDFDPFKQTLICDQNLVQVTSLLKNNFKSKKSFPRIIQSSSLEVVSDLVRSKAGVGILPAKVAMRGSQNKLISLSRFFGSYQDQICLIYRADTPRTVAHKAITIAVKKAFLT